MELFVFGLSVLKEVLSLTDDKCTHLPVLLGQLALIASFGLALPLVFEEEGLWLSAKPVNG